jgi:uncharacterized protein YgiM (DUF1202 family)
LNPLNLLTTTNALLLLAGLLILGVNVVFSAIRLQRGHLRAGVIGVLATLVACALITVGLVRTTFPALGGGALPGVAGLAAPGSAEGTSAAQDGASAQPGPSGQQPGGANPAAETTLPAPLMTAMASGRIPAPVMTQIAEGTLPARQFGGGNRPGGNAGGSNASASGTPETGRNAGGNGTGGRPNRANGGNAGGNPNGNNAATPAAGGVAGGNTGGDSANGGNAGGNPTGGNAGGGTRFGGSAGGNFAAAQTEAQANQIYAAVLVVGAILIGVAGIFLYRRERERDAFEPSWSPGLLYIGAGVFVLVAALVIPALPGQFFVARAGSAGRFAGTPNGPLPTRVGVQTSTPTATPVPSSTPTALPTLTPAPSESPTPLFTAIAYASTDTALSTTAPCTLSAQTMLNLRGDPSVQQQAIGKIFAGALLSATGRTADGKWWRVISTNDVSPVEGWVSADFVKVVSGCADEAIPVVGPTLTPSRTPRPSRTPVPSRTPRPSATPRQTATSVPASSVEASPSPTSTPSATAIVAQAGAESCTIMTTVSISLRPDPSKTQPPLAQIPEGTALTATSKTADGGWWHVTYPAADGNKEGWIGNAGVFPASACASLPAVTP